MKVLAKTVAVLFVAIAAFLVYAVIAAVTSAGGANVPVCVGYVAGSAVLCFLPTCCGAGITARQQRTHRQRLSTRCASSQR